MSRVEWLGEQASAGCAERSFLLRRRSGIVPGVLWSPGTVARPPAVLLFHGESGHKRSERHLRMGRRLASAGLAVIAVDGPYHGDRVASPVAPAVYQQLIVDEGIGFDGLASADKRLIARSGPHAETHPDDEASWQEFIRTSAPGACGP